MEQSPKVLSTSKKEDSLQSKIKAKLFENSVPLFFVVICLLAIYFSQLQISFIFDTLLNRLMRNSFLVMALIIPVIAGLGLNFSIVIGAMAAQFAMIAVTHWGIYGFGGLILCFVLVTPMALLFGMLIGNLMNKTKGQEMICGMIAGFFSDGIYQFILLFLIGTLIPMSNAALVLSRGIGLRNTIDLSRNGGLKYAMDNLMQLPFFHVLLFASVMTIVILLLLTIIQKKKKIFTGWIVLSCLCAALSSVIIYSKSIVHTYELSGALKSMFVVFTQLSMVQLPIATTIAISLLALFTILIIKTKMGMDFRTVGQDMHIAKVSGINVDKVRITAMVLSTILASWGHLIYLQNMGTIATYGSHVQIGTFSIAALLIGGATVTRATVGQAFLGIILFHTLFIVSPKAGNNLFGDAQIGEFFRAFIAYGAIGLSLGLHAWKKMVEHKRKELARI